MSVYQFSTKYGAVSKDDQQTKPNHSILIVDDDPSFRQLVNVILSEKGYEVWEAKSADDAFAYLETASPALVLVDYRLPGMDGIEWIKALRDRGNYVPAVLVTGAWIDATTFKWVRSMLRVSLVMQKPIAPAAFLQSIESIIPPPSAAAEKQKLLGAPDEAYQKRIATQHALAEARREFIAALPELWAAFVEDVKVATQAMRKEGIQPALNQAHRLCGTVGSYGFMNLSTTCGRLEHLLASLDPTSNTMHPLVVSEIDRCMMEGERFIQQALRTDGPAPAAIEHRFTVLAVLPEHSRMCEELIQLGLTQDGLQIEFAHTEMGAQIKCKNNKYDAVIMDAALDPNLHLSKLIRATPRYLRLPFAFVAAEGDAIDRYTYAGASEIVSPNATAADLSELLSKLRKHSEARKPRILCIDDDPELTKFVEAVLHEEGYVVQSLNEPIQALEVAQEFRPDLILVDALMPGISGFDVCRAIKTHERTRAIPVLFLTATSDATSRSCAYQSGAEDFVTKPIVVDELIARTKKYLPAVVDRLGPGGSALIDKGMFMNTVNHYISDKESGGVVFLLSIDEMGYLDSAHGALAADQVSSVLARLISLRFRPTDLRTQLDRDRFAAFTPDIDAIQAEGVVQALQAELSGLTFAGKNGGQFRPNISVHSAHVGSNDELHA
jgi:DNA-binding response OmpR family regulator